MVAGPHGAETARVRDATERFRAGHELGHAFFFDAGMPPRRLVPHGRHEEAFCDAFSRSLLVPGPLRLPKEAEELVRAADDLHLSVEILAGAAVDRTPGLAILGGLVADGAAAVCFVAGAPGIPTEATFRWPERGGPFSLLKAGLYWPQGNPALLSADGWSDGLRFLVVARIDSSLSDAAA